MISYAPALPGYPQHASPTWPCPQLATPKFSLAEHILLYLPGALYRKLGTIVAATPPPNTTGTPKLISDRSAL